MEEEEKEQTTKLGTLTQELRDHAVANNEELVDLNDKDAIANTELGKIRSGIGTVIGKLIFGFRDLAETIVGNDLLKMEQQRELTAYLEKIGNNTQAAAEDKADDKKKEKSDVKIEGLSGILGAAAASLLIIPGFAVGFVESIGRVLGVGKKGKGGGFIGRITKGFANITKSIKGLFATIKMGIQLFFLNIGTKFKLLTKTVSGGFLSLFKSIGNSFKAFFKTNKVGIVIAKAFKPIFGFLKTLLNLSKTFAGQIKNIAGMFKGLVLNKSFKPLFDGIKGLVSQVKNIGGLFKGAGGGGKLFSTFTKILNPIKNFFSTFAKMAPKFFALGRTFGRLFLPLTIVFGIFDGLKGAIKGAEEQEGFFNKLIGGLGGAISGILENLIGLPLDLLKDGVAWILGKFGMNDAAAALKGFSFKDLIGTIIDVPVEFLIGIVDNIKGIFAGDGSFLAKLIKTVGELVANLYTYPLSLIQGLVVKIGEFFGFDMSAVSDFDLAGKIKNLIRLPFDMIAGAFDFIKNMFSKEGRAENMSKIKDIGSKINDFLKKIVAFLLPKPDPNGAWYSPSNLASKAIPKAIYDYAGIDKETGAEIPADGAMFTDAEGNLTENVMDFDVSSLSESAQKAIGKMQDNLQDNIEKQAKIDEEMFMLENKDGELTKKEAKKLQKLRKEKKKLEKEEEQAESDIRLAVSREAELTERPEVIKDEFGGVETGIRVDGIAQDIEPGSEPQNIFKNADVARAAADADMRKLEEESAEFLQLQEKLDAALAASSREKFDMNTEEGIEAKRQADLEVQYLTKQLQEQDDKMTATADRIALNSKADTDYKSKIQDLRVMGDETQVVNESISQIDSSEQKVSNTENKVEGQSWWQKLTSAFQKVENNEQTLSNTQVNNALESNVSDNIKPVENTQGAQMEATISDTEEAKAVANTVVNQNLASPTTNNNNVSSSNITVNQAAHIDKTDKLAFA